jgi:hypothetical protein
MATVENINPETEPVPRAWVPRVVTGGKGPPEPPEDIDTNWLKTLKAGHTFICRQGPKSIDYELYHIIFVKDEMYLLKWALPDGKLWDRYVDSKIFSNLYRDHKVMGYIDPQQFLEETPTKGDEHEHTDGQSDRPD